MKMKTTTNSYKEVKEFIFNNLKKQDIPNIQKEMDSIKEILKETNIHINIFKIEYIDLNDDDLHKMQRELETQFNVESNLLDFLLDNEPRYLLTAEASNGESLELTEGTLSECKDYEKYDRENGQTAEILQIFKYYYKRI